MELVYQWVLVLYTSFLSLRPQDNQRIVDTLKTGFPIPGNLDFEEYQGKHNKKSAQKKSKVCNLCVMMSSFRIDCSSALFPAAV